MDRPLFELYDDFSIILSVQKFRIFTLLYYQGREGQWCQSASAAPLLFPYAKSRSSHDMVHMINTIKHVTCVVLEKDKASSCLFQHLRFLYIPAVTSPSPPPTPGLGTCVVLKEDKASSCLFQHLHFLYIPAVTSPSQPPTPGLDTCVVLEEDKASSCLFQHLHFLYIPAVTSPSQPPTPGLGTCVVLKEDKASSCLFQHLHFLYIPAVTSPSQPPTPGLGTCVVLKEDKASSCLFQHLHFLYIPAVTSLSPTTNPEPRYLCNPGRKQGKFLSLPTSSISLYHRRYFASCSQSTTVQYHMTLSSSD